LEVPLPEVLVDLTGALETEAEEDFEEAEERLKKAIGIWMVGIRCIWMLLSQWSIMVALIYGCSRSCQVSCGVLWLANSLGNFHIPMVPWPWNFNGKLGRCLLSRSHAFWLYQVFASLCLFQNLLGSKEIKQRFYLYYLSYDFGDGV
jgi:hypothetical protein